MICGRAVSVSSASTFPGIQFSSAFNFLLRSIVYTAWSCCTSFRLNELRARSLSCLEKKLLIFFIDFAPLVQPIVRPRQGRVRYSPHRGGKKTA
jgi:hypothetical protein